MERSPPLDLARSERAHEDLAKAWILDVIERTPLAELPEIRVTWLAREAAPLVGDILRAVADPGLDLERLLGGEARDRARELADLHRTDAGAVGIPRDLAALHKLVIEALRREVPERQPGEFARAVQRLADVFGTVQAAVTDALVRERSGGARRDELTGLPGQAELHEWLQVLVAEYRRYGHPFATLMVDIEGLRQINDAYGRPSGDRMLAAIANVIRNQIRTVDRAFRRGGGEFCVLSPHSDADHVRPLAERLVAVVDSSQAEQGPRVGVSIGLASCPEHAETAERLLEAAEEATFEAKADGDRVALAGRV